MEVWCILFANRSWIAIIVKFVYETATMGQQEILEVTITAKLDNNKQFSCVIKLFHVSSIIILLPFNLYYSKPLIRFLVQAPSRLTTLKCLPKWMRILSSDAREDSAVSSTCDLTILTATVELTIPTAWAWTTRPNWPAPNCLPNISICK